MTPRSIALALGSACAGGLLVFLAMRQPAAVSPTRVPEPSPPTAAAAPTPRASPFASRDRSRDDDDAREPATPPTPPTPVVAVAPDPVAAGRRDDPQAPPASAPPASAPPLPPASPALEAAIARANVAAKAAAERVHTKMRRACWDALSDRPDTAQLEFSLSYDAEGNVIASAVQQGRENYREELRTCLATHATGLKIEAPGEPVSLSVPVEFP